MTKKQEEFVTILASRGPIYKKSVLMLVTELAEQAFVLFTKTPDESSADHHKYNRNLHFVCLMMMSMVCHGDYPNYALDIRARQVFPEEEAAAFVADLRGKYEALSAQAKQAVSATLEERFRYVGPLEKGFG